MTRGATQSYDSFIHYIKFSKTKVRDKNKTRILRRRYYPVKESLRLCLIILNQDTRSALATQRTDPIGMRFGFCSTFTNTIHDVHETSSHRWGGPKGENRKERDGTSECYRWLAKDDLMTKTGYGYAKCLTALPHLPPS